jgi:hypothetical protein
VLLSIAGSYEVLAQRAEDIDRSDRTGHED